MRQSATERESLKAGISARLDAKKYLSKPSLVRQERMRACKPAKIVAYDYETSRIKAGESPRPLYITAYAPSAMHLESAINDMAHLLLILKNNFLTPELKRTKFVAWNGNRFDAFITAVALITDSEYRIKPYLSRSKSVRGLKITLKSDHKPNATESEDMTVAGWEFLDGIAMLGLVGTSLAKFLSNFAPDYAKLTGVIDFDKEEFNPENPKHREYALRDSVGLWHGMARAQEIMIDTFNEPLSVTMGATCIKIFKAHIPCNVEVESLIPDVESIINTHVLRGGYCFCVKRFQGPIWKYDINQAYASAMRDGPLPCGAVLRSTRQIDTSRQAYIVRLRAFNSQNKIPFYYRTLENARIKSKFGVSEIEETWVTSIEHRQLIAEGWAIETMEAYLFSSHFDMREFVDKLESLRMRAEGGPSGPIGTMIKATGNHSYGKTVERVDPVDYLIAADCPVDYYPYYGDGATPINHVFWRFVEASKPKSHHQPHIGAFITANVRMVLRRAALISPDEWLYADTDCVVFSCDVTDKLDIDKSRYGAWKIEESGAEYRIIAKKVYSSIDGKHNSAKGLNADKLSASDFERWYGGTPPEQNQTQLQNFLAVMSGADMFRAQKRRGTAV
jgi:hypothetical protein